MLLSIDPGSRCTGWCVAELDPFKITSIGSIEPAGKNTEERIRNLARMLRALLSYKISEVVIEMPSGKVTKRHGGGGSGLSIYGVACGIIWQKCCDTGWINNVHWVTPRNTKEKNYKVALRAYPDLKRMKDPGKDISDAIALAVWWNDIGRKKIGKKNARS